MQDYDQDEPRNTTHRLMAVYEIALGEAAAQPAAREATSDTGADAPAPARLIVVDDHALVRECLVGLINLQPDLRVVGQAGSLREAVALARSLRPDMILMDFTLPDGTGDEATRIIRAMLPQIKIVFLTVHDDDERLFAALSAGAMGYLLKSVRSADLLSQLRGAARGEVALSPSIGRRILEGFVCPPARPAIRHALTEREAEILGLIGQGHTNREIADALHLSVRTVEYHRANLTDKLGLHSRVDLVRYAAEHGLLDTPVRQPRPLERRAVPRQPLPA